jgi:dihydrodipicolinate synthase/N-acetylneuraminate lyase
MNWSGCFAIPMTPYTEQDRIDEAILADEINFIVESGAGGIVAPVMVSEFTSLSEEERKLMVRVAVEAAAKRTPVVANCAAVNTRLAVEYAVYSQEVGADGVIAMPPYAMVPDFEKIYAYFQAINDAVTIPIMIQNAGLAPLSPDQVVRLCSELEHVKWVKEEVQPGPKSISRLAARKSPNIHGIMGGMGGLHLLNERARGAVGNIPACEFCDMIQRVWDLLDAGETKQAEDLFEVVLPGIVLEGLLGMAYAKEIMIRRGVFTNRRMRAQSNPLDEADMLEVDRMWARLEPHLIWHRK